MEIRTARNAIPASAAGRCLSPQGGDDDLFHLKSAFCGVRAVSADARLILRASVGLEDPKTFGKKA